MAKRYYLVTLKSITYQRKIVEASCRKEALEIGNELEWNEKEEVGECRLKAKHVLKEEVIGRYVDTRDSYFRLEK